MEKPIEGEGQCRAEDRTVTNGEGPEFCRRALGIMTMSQRVVRKVLHSASCHLNTCKSVVFPKRKNIKRKQKSSRWKDF